MRFIFLFISAISIQCYAASEAMELHYCETVKKAASGVMDARQHEVPAKELHDIANHLEEQQAKQLYQELIKPHVLQSYSKALSLSPTLSKISKPQHWLSAVKKERRY